MVHGGSLLAWKVPFSSGTFVGKAQNRHGVVDGVCGT